MRQLKIKDLRFRISDFGFRIVFLLFNLSIFLIFQSFNCLYAIITESYHPYIDWVVPHKKGTSEIIYNYDGDTVTTSQNTKIRLLGVNTPELKPYQAGSKEARDFTKKFCVGREVDIVAMNSYQRDKYGRLLALVFVDDKCLNWELLKNDLAEPMVFPQATILKRDMWENSQAVHSQVVRSQTNDYQTKDYELHTGWAKLIKPKEQPKQEPSVSTPTARAILTKQEQAEPLPAYPPTRLPAEKEAIVMAFGGKQIIPKPITAEQKSKSAEVKPKSPAPKIIVGNVLIEAGKSYRLRLITSGQGHYVLEVTALCGE